MEPKQPNRSHWAQRLDDWEQMAPARPGEGPGPAFWDQLDAALPPAPRRRRFPFWLWCLLGLVLLTQLTGFFPEMGAFPLPGGDGPVEGNAVVAAAGTVPDGGMDKIDIASAGASAAGEMDGLDRASAGASAAGDSLKVAAAGAVPDGGVDSMVMASAGASADGEVDGLDRASAGASAAGDSLKVATAGAVPDGGVDSMVMASAGASADGEVDRLDRASAGASAAGDSLKVAAAGAVPDGGVDSMVMASAGASADGEVDRLDRASAGASAAGDSLKVAAAGAVPDGGVDSMVMASAGASAAGGKPSLSIGIHYAPVSNRTQLTIDPGVLTARRSRETRAPELGLSLYVGFGAHWGLRTGLTSTRLKTESQYRFIRFFNPQQETANQNGDGLSKYDVEVASAYAKSSAEVDLIRPSDRQLQNGARLRIDLRLRETVASYAIPLQVTYGNSWGRFGLAGQLGPEWNHIDVLDFAAVATVQIAGLRADRVRIRSRERISQSNYWSLSGGLAATYRVGQRWELGLIPEFTTSLENLSARPEFSARSRTAGVRLEVRYRVSSKTK